VTTGARSYGGKSAETRLAERRQRLIQAAFEIWGDQGWAAVTVRGVCAHSGVHDRYFYENFADRDALLVEVWDRVIAEILELLMSVIADTPSPDPETLIRAAVPTVIHDFAADPRRARIAFGDHAGNAALAQRRRDDLDTLAVLGMAAARPYLPPDSDGTDLRISMIIGLGGVGELITSWHAGSLALDTDEFTERSVRVALNIAGPLFAARPLLRSPPEPRAAADRAPRTPDDPDRTGTSSNRSDTSSNRSDTSTDRTGTSTGGART
jgi:AcrR family transcriptional regulator